MSWLTLLTALPPTPTRHRVGVWRKLQRMGAVRLRGSAWILLETPETTEQLQSLAQLRGTLDGLKQELHRTQAIDYLAAPAGQPRGACGRPRPSACAPWRRARARRVVVTKRFPGDRRVRGMLGRCPHVR